MSTIWKWELAPMPSITGIEMPDGAEILCMREQNGVPVVWARVDPGRLPKLRAIHTCWTGKEAPDTGRYVGTALLADGVLALHAFEQTE